MCVCNHKCHRLEGVKSLDFFACSQVFFSISTEQPCVSYFFLSVYLSDYKKRKRNFTIFPCIVKHSFPTTRTTLDLTVFVNRSLLIEIELLILSDVFCQHDLLPVL